MGVSQEPQSEQTGRPLLYVLSAGRTGTVFMEKLIRRYFPQIDATHEPSPSRYLLMLGNLRNDTGLLKGATRAFARRHQAAQHDRARPHIELNPFLCPVTDLLPHPTRPLRIVHMVRDPGEWAQSMTTFKASSKYRHIIDFVPFAKPFPSPRPPGWMRLSPFEKSLHRWNWCNARIEALAPQAESYALVRAEDVFGLDTDRRAAAVTAIFDTLGLEAPSEIDPAIFGQKVNPAPSGHDLRDAQAVRTICGPLARRYGYDL